MLIFIRIRRSRGPARRVQLGQRQSHACRGRALLCAPNCLSSRIQRKRRGNMPSAAHQLLRGFKGRCQVPTRIPMLLGSAFADGGGGRRQGNCFLQRVPWQQMLYLRQTGNLRNHRRALYSTLVPSDEISVQYKHGLPVITLTLPSRKERCQFIVKPLLMTVGAFLKDIKREDNTIEKVEVFTADGSIVSNSALMEVLLMNDFKLTVNGTEYSVQPPLKEKMTTEHTTEIDDIKSIVHRLFVALHIEEHQMRKERELMQKMELLKEELVSLEKMKAQVSADTDVKTSRLLWVGLALLSTQGGALAWLTWWVYSWDIMEPVTYFITYGSTMAFYAYFVLTKQDCIYPDVRDRQFLHYFHQKSKTQNFNMAQYNKLKEDLAKVEESLKRLRDPLLLRLPVQEIKDKH